jgi:hypothetical protein
MANTKTDEFLTKFNPKNGGNVRNQNRAKKTAKNKGKTEVRPDRFISKATDLDVFPPKDNSGPSFKEMDEQKQSKQSK